MNASDIDVRVANERLPAPAPLVNVHDLPEGGAVASDEGVKVTAALADHPPVVPRVCLRAAVAGMVRLGIDLRRKGIRQFFAGVVGKWLV